MDQNNLDQTNEPLNNVSLGSQPIENTQIQTSPIEVQQPIEQPVEKTKKSKNKKPLIFILIGLLIILLGVAGYLYFNRSDSSKIENSHKKNSYRISGNDLENFDLYFLKLENEEKNKIYSPLSIKYALAMLNEGTDGNSNEEIKSLIGDYNANKYTNSDNMSLANALFIKNSFKESVKVDYSNKLTNKYDAEVIFDEFTAPDNINNWVSKKTFNLINDLLDDVTNNDFILVNALAIDMEWQEKFINKNDRRFLSYLHEKGIGEEYYYSWIAPDDLKSSTFENVSEEISGMEIIASLNNYDIITELGEDNIRKTVGDELRKFLVSHPEEDLYIRKANGETYDYKYVDDSSEAKVNEVVNDYLDEYIKQISENYGKIGYNTDFSYYVDDDVKVFAKDLKEYNGTTLQYVGIMPTNEKLNTYISNTDSTKIKSLISNLKTLELNNVEKGAITEIKGYIPKFKFEYELNLMEDLKTLGIKDVFDSSKADLSKISTTKGSYISNASHKANIEFTQDGIKASAATTTGGLGAGGSFDYFYEVPIIRIDLTFDKPYMFLIRDKKTGEVWFTGTVYTPTLWKDDTTKTIW